MYIQIYLYAFVSMFFFSLSSQNQQIYAFDYIAILNNVCGYLFVVDFFFFIFFLLFYMKIVILIICDTQWIWKFISIIPLMYVCMLSINSLLFHFAL